MEYESKLNRFLPRYPQVILCLYELDRFSGEVLVDVLKTHPRGAARRDGARQPVLPRARRVPRHPAVTSSWPASPNQPPTAELREQLSNLRGPADAVDADDRERRRGQDPAPGQTSVPSFGCCHLVGVYLRSTAAGGARRRRSPAREVRPRSRRSSTRSGATVGRRGPGELGLGLPARSLAGHIGYHRGRAADEPSPVEQFLLRVLAQQTGVALANARLHAQGGYRRGAAGGADTRSNRSRRWSAHADPRPADSGRGVRRGAGGHRPSRARADRLPGRHRGPLRQPARLGRPEPARSLPEGSAGPAGADAAPCAARGRPIREGGRLVAVASPRADVLGVLALVDPGRTAGDQEQSRSSTAPPCWPWSSLACAASPRPRCGLGATSSRSCSPAPTRRARSAGPRRWATTSSGRTVSWWSRAGPTRGTTMCSSTRSAGGPRHGRRGRCSSPAAVPSSSVRRRRTVGAVPGGRADRAGRRPVPRRGGRLVRRPSDFPAPTGRPARPEDAGRLATGDQATAFEDLGVYRILSEVEDSAASSSSSATGWAPCSTTTPASGRSWCTPSVGTSSAAAATTPPPLRCRSTAAR